MTIWTFLKFISDTSIRYLFYKPAKCFDHFDFVYNRMRDCKSRVEKILNTKERKNIMPKEVVIKIGIIGNFQEENLDLISRRTCTVQFTLNAV